MARFRVALLAQAQESEWEFLFGPKIHAMADSIAAPPCFPVHPAVCVCQVHACMYTCVLVRARMCVCVFMCGLCVCACVRMRVSCVRATASVYLCGGKHMCAYATRDPPTSHSCKRMAHAVRALKAHLPFLSHCNSLPVAHAC